MSKKTLLCLTFASAALAPAVPQAQVYFWRDGRNIANYADLCPVGVACGVRPIRIRHSGYLDAASTRITDVPAIASSTPASSNAPTSLAQFGTGGAAGASGFGGGGATGGGVTGGGAGGGGGVTSASAALQIQPGPRSAPSASSALAPSAPPASQPMPTAPSDAQPALTAANTSTSSNSSRSGLRSPIGTNLEGLSYWSPQLPFVDVMKSSSEWISGDSFAWDNNQAVDLDVNGWVRSLAPGQIARKLMVREIGDRYPAGRYLVRYHGEGKLMFAFAAKVVSERAGETVIEVTPSAAGILINIEQTNPANYIRDIEVITPGGICEGDPFTHVTGASDCGSRTFLSFADNRSILFYPVFANRLRSYSVLRFMDWMATNNSPAKDWSQRTQMSYSTWATAGGAPLEVMIALANLVGAHPWFTIPHEADDAYAQSFAQVVKARLDPALSVYVEHSNEVWNSQFSQYAYAVKQAAAETPPIDNIQYHAQRSRALGQIFKAVLGESRVIAVLGAQAVSPWTATHGLEYLKSRLGAYSTLGIDAVAIAPYFGVAPTPAEAAKFSAMTLDDFFTYVRNSVLPDSRKSAASYRAVADRYKLSLIAYEGGQHMVGRLGAEGDASLNALFDAFNRDRRIKQLYLDYLGGWRQAGGELFVHFADVGRYTKWGRWGALEYIAQPRQTAPKYDAIQTFIEQTQVWWPQ